MKNIGGLFDGINERLCIDQDGEIEFARSLRELRKKAGGRASNKMTSRRHDDHGDFLGIFHDGYVINGRAFTIYAPVEKMWGPWAAMQAALGEEENEEEETLTLADCRVRELPGRKSNSRRRDPGASTPG